MTSTKSVTNDTEEILIDRLQNLAEEAIENEDYDMAVGIARYLYNRRQLLLKETK